MQKTTEVKTYFTDRARLFDSLYDGDSVFMRAFNKAFRAPMFTRYVYTLEALGTLKGKKILDVGCGSGRYAVALADKGALVTGVDFSDEMLTMARERAAWEGVADRVTFLSGDFTEFADEHHDEFDAAFAMGVLDYVEDAAGFMRHMAATARHVIASFPRPTMVRGPLRKWRYARRNCPVHF